MLRRHAYTPRYLPDLSRVCGLYSTPLTTRGGYERIEGKDHL